MMMYVSIYMADCIVEGGFVDIFVEDFPVEKGLVMNPMESNM